MRWRRFPFFLMFTGGNPSANSPLFTTFKEFMKKLEEKRVGLSKATSMGEAILSICHPDSITTIKHWNTIIKARFEEVSAQLLAGSYTSHMCGFDRTHCTVGMCQAEKNRFITVTITYPIWTVFVSYF